MQSHNWQNGFWYGTSVSGGATTPRAPLAVHKRGQPIPFAQMFIRPASWSRTSPRRFSRHWCSRAERSGHSRRQVRRPALAVTDLNRGQTQLGAYVLGLAESGNTMFVGGKFRSVQHGQGGPKSRRATAAFNRDTGEFIRPSTR
jgi:hypothetical protein